MNVERDGHDSKPGTSNRASNADGDRADGRHAPQDMRDPVLEALMREHSTETPSPALDAAILAAAAQAVERLPTIKRARPAAAWRVWLPLAAAAVVAIVAFGLVPLAPTVRNDMSDVLRDEASPAASSAPPGKRTVAPAEQRDVAPAASNVAPVENRNVAPAENRNVAPGQSGAAAIDSARDTRQDQRETLPPRRAQEAPPRARTLGAPPTPTESRGKISAPAAAPPVPSGETGGPASSSADRPSQSARKAERAEPAAALRKNQSASDRSESDRALHARIDRIRALRDAGNTREAVQELARFRDAYADADARLPDDLRQWATALP